MTADVDMLARTAVSGCGAASDGFPEVRSSGRGLGRLVGAGLDVAAPVHAAVGSESLGISEADVAARGGQAAASLNVGVEARAAESGGRAGVEGVSEIGSSGQGLGRLVGAGFDIAAPIPCAVGGGSLGQGGASGAGAAGRSRLRRARGAIGAGEAASLMPGSLDARASAAQDVHVPRLGPRIVTGFGEERVEDVLADEARRVAEGVRRGERRRDEGVRGRMRDMGDQDLDRSAGGAWHLGRR